MIVKIPNPGPRSVSWFRKTLSGGFLMPDFGVRSFIRGCCALAILLTQGLSAQAAAPASITVQANKPGAKIGPLFYGLMTEEINHSYDGGLYAELIQNRGFHDGELLHKPSEAVHWSLVKSGVAEASMKVDSTDTVNTTGLRTSLRLDAAKVGEGERAGVANDGYWGIPVWPNTKYRAAVWVRAGKGFSGSLALSIETNDGKTTFARAEVPQVGATWKKYQVELRTGSVPVSTKNRFVVSMTSPGTVWLGSVSLFPPTYNNRPNGTRIDIMEKLAALNPRFLRFPGGNYLEGDHISERFDWKKMIGPVEQRPGHRCCWNYPSSDGFGLLEFLEWCEDLHMEPVLAIYAGFSLSPEVCTPEQLKGFVQDGLDEIEYAMGDAKTTWGARRAADGHPAPFALHYVEIGNEDGGFGYAERFAAFFDAIKAKYPGMKVIATCGVPTRRADIVDEHLYASPETMLRKTDMYDHRASKLPPVFVGEWATMQGTHTATLRAALGDAAWLTALQRNSGTVLMNCYAPLFVNVHHEAPWQPDLVGYDAARCYGSTSYYAHAMFANAWGDVNLPTTVVSDEANREFVPHGAIGVGTWETAAEFKDVRVTRGDTVLFQSTLSKGIAGWQIWRGVNEWDVADGALQQKAERDCCVAIAGDKSWRDYTLTLKARKTRGREGFLIVVHQDGEFYTWCNIGGWGNSGTAFQLFQDGDNHDIGPHGDFKVEAGKWYDIRLEVNGRHLKAFVDNRLVAEADELPPKPYPTLYAAASRDDATGDIILKVVNVHSKPLTTNLTIKGVTGIDPKATVEVLTGQPDDQNTVDQPTKIIPEQEQINNAGRLFTHAFPAFSVSVMRLKARVSPSSTSRAEPPQAVIGGKS
jgi:alpha-L-arabinofuranosidase